MKELYPDFEFLKALARKAGDTMIANFKLNVACTWKGDNTPLTATDTAINDMVVAKITENFPHITVAGEECAGTAQESEYLVVCDPVDGTMCFANGVPICTFCISVVKKGFPISAIIYDPFQERMWHAKKGGGAWENDRLIRVSQHATIKQSYVYIAWRKQSIRQLDEADKKLKAAEAITMNMPSIAYFGGLIAAGKFHGTIMPEAQIWETPAMQIIIEEAGGRVTDIDGNIQQYRMGVPMNGRITSNGILHNKLLAIVNEKS